MSIRHCLAAALLAVVSFTASAAVDVNQASRAELESVKGIGPALSGKIMAARETSRFKDWADLVDRVGGLGPGNAQRLSTQGLTVGGAAYAAADAPRAEARKPARQTERAEQAERSPAPKAGAATDAAAAKANPR